MTKHVTCGTAITMARQTFTSFTRVWMFAKQRVMETALLSFTWHLIECTIVGAFVKCACSGNRALE